MLHTKPICISHSLPYKWTLKRRRREAIQLRVFHFSFLPHIYYSHSLQSCLLQKSKSIMKMSEEVWQRWTGIRTSWSHGLCVAKMRKCFFEKREINPGKVNKRKFSSGLSCADLQHLACYNMAMFDERMRMKTHRSCWLRPLEIQEIEHWLITFRHGNFSKNNFTDPHALAKL